MTSGRQAHRLRVAAKVTRWVRARHVDDDRGTSLVELMVGMALMSIFMAIFTVAVVAMIQTVNKVQTVNTSSSQVNQAFLRLDKLVRYAAAISTPGVGTTGGWYVELDSANTGTDTCTQFRVLGQTLQMRSWPAATQPPATFTGVAVASNISNGMVAIGSPDTPFVVPIALAGASTSFQRLQVTLASTAGTTSTSTNRSQMTFTALNSSVAATSNNTVCQSQFASTRP